ncbi:phosphotransferase family enzyme [Kribbella rubisoli]|uniref:Phosphotransferase family enzyme n=1 Tax=Kribbella rubisoli TaxID=3075929 RepID=A0A4Q7WZ54_9ACTN|nr:glyoxalase superfamily protein [Kribbella rubisoli]RZU15864.1 phosphotransferase family enzyme [Kribbella rubisoli]
MKLLPDRPSIEFLRKEAKDLLAVLRDSSPETSLAEAQRALAAEYGVRDWPALKAEVERRVAATPAAPNGLAEALAGAFGLGTVTAAPRPVSFTAMGRCWELTTDRGRWLAVTVFDWITNEQAELGARLRDAAAAVGVAAPVAVRSPRGLLVEGVQDENWRIHEWLEVGPSPALPVSADVARRAGAAYGKLHALAIPTETPMNPYIVWRRPESEWDKLLERARTAGKPWADRLEAVLPLWLDLQTIEAEVDPAELILCNSNLIPTHVRLGRDGELIVMEWDFTGSMTPALELGSALTQWVMRPTVNHKALAAFREGYGEWPAIELSSFSAAISSWLNWAYNAICEAIDPQDSDHAEFAEREAVGVLDRPMTRVGLEQLLEVRE